MSFNPMVLYDPDSDDSSSDGGAAMAIAGIHKYDDDDGLSLHSDLFEEYEDREMMPSGMEKSEARKYGKGLILSDADSVGDDDAFAAPTMKTRLAVAAHDDEHSIGSDDEFVPQTRKTTRKTITKNDRQFDALIPTSSKPGIAEGDGGQAHAQAHAAPEAHASAPGSRAASDAVVAQGLALASRIRSGAGAGVAPNKTKAKLTSSAPPAPAPEPASPVSVAGSSSTRSPSTPSSPSVAVDVGSDTLSLAPYGSGTTLKDNHGTSYSKRAVSENPDLRARLRGFLAKYKGNNDELTKAIKSRLGQR